MNATNGHAPDGDWTQRTREVSFDGRPLIDGVRREVSAGAAFDVVDPATGARLYQAHACGRQEVDAAVASARALIERDALRRIDAATRIRILLALAQRLQQDGARFALYDCLEIGKPIAFAQMEVQAAAEIFRYCASAVDKLRANATIPARGALSLELLEPCGIVAAIIPWNFPTVQAASRIGMAIATGNACMLKPSEMAMASALALAHEAIECGWPPGALAVLTGDGRVGHWLASHADVDVVSFIGSTKTGQDVHRAAASGGFKKVGLECGGKSPVVVLADAGSLDRDLIAQTIVQDVMWNQGQVCTAKTRLVVEQSMFDDLMARVAAACEQWVPGDPLNVSTNFGPLGSARQQQLVRGHIADGLRQGARQVYGQNVALPLTGAFVAPTVLAVTDPAAGLLQEEIFGPVLTAIPARDAAHAFELANSGRYGLSACLWTTNLARAHTYISQTRAGMIRVNGSSELAEEPLWVSASEPYQASGVGPEGGLSGLESWMRRKAAFISYGS